MSKDSIDLMFSGVEFHFTPKHFSLIPGHRDRCDRLVVIRPNLPRATFRWNTRSLRHEGNASCRGGEWLNLNEMIGRIIGSSPMYQADALVELLVWTRRTFSNCEWRIYWDWESDEHYAVLDLWNEELGQWIPVLADSTTARLTKRIRNISLEEAMSISLIISTDDEDEVNAFLVEQFGTDEEEEGGGEDVGNMGPVAVAKTTGEHDYSSWSRFGEPGQAKEVTASGVVPGRQVYTGATDDLLKRMSR